MNLDEAKELLSSCRKKETKYHNGVVNVVWVDGQSTTVAIGEFLPDMQIRLVYITRDGDIWSFTANDADQLRECGLLVFTHHSPTLPPLDDGDSGRSEWMSLEEAEEILNFCHKEETIYSDGSPTSVNWTNALGRPVASGAFDKDNQVIVFLVNGRVHMFKADQARGLRGYCASVTVSRQEVPDPEELN